MKRFHLLLTCAVALLFTLTLSPSLTTANAERPAKSSRGETVEGQHSEVLAKKKPKKKKVKKKKRAAKCKTKKQKRKARCKKASKRSTAVTNGGRWAYAIDTKNRAAVNAAYMSQYAPGIAIRPDWTGNNANCVAGSISNASLTASHRAINLMRSLAGLTPITLSGDLNYKAQQAALIMSANSALSHHPSSSWKCHSAVGAAAAGVSNIGLQYPWLSSAGIVGAYMNETGSNNTFVGHRRWLLNPFATVMGIGSTTFSNAIVVVAPERKSNPNPAWVSWPTENYFPYPLEPNRRWSLSSGNKSANFSGATVSMTKGNGIPVGTQKFAPKNGYAQPTLVWTVGEDIDQTATYNVSVRNIKIGGKSVNYSYKVNMFYPN